MFQKCVLTAVVAWLGWSAPAEATFQNPTFNFAWCTKIGALNYWEMRATIEADDFIAVCGGGGPMSSPTFIDTWKKAVETCRRGGVPDLSKPRHAQGILRLKGGTYTTKIGCEKVFEIATNYGVISADGKASPTFKAWWCHNPNAVEGLKTDMVEPDDFIAVCARSDDVGTPSFIDTWKKAVGMCRQGDAPNLSNPPRSLDIKGKTVTTNIDCEKVFEIATKFGVISAQEASAAKAVWKDAASVMEKLKRASAAGVWEAKFFLAVKYLDFESTEAADSALAVAVGDKYHEGLAMAEQLAADGHGDAVFRYLAPIEEKGKRDGHFPTIYSVYQVHGALSQGGHAASALKVCQTEVEQAILHFENPTPGHSDAEALYKVQKGCGRAAELGGEKIKWLIDDLGKQVAIAQKASDERKEVTRQAQREAAKQLFEWIVTAIATAPPSPPQDNSRYEQCKYTQDLALAFGDKHMISGAHVVACF